MNPIFEWDSAKAAANVRKHGVRFEVAERVFFDPYVYIEQDRIEDGEYRWQAIGLVGGVLLLLVAHTTRFETDGTEVIRLISARQATKPERRRYEQRFG